MRLQSFLLVLAVSLAFGSLSWSAEETGALLARDGQTLAARWVTPQPDVRLAVVILPGYGNTASDGDVSSPFIGSGYHGQPAKLSDQLAAALARAGVASVRYDKRGFANPKELDHQTFPFLVSDAKAAVAAVRARFPSAKVGIAGFSEGALVATLVAADEPIDKLFLISLPTRSIDESLGYQMVAWPIDLLRNKLKAAANGELVGASSPLPLLGVTWQSLDADHNGTLSLGSELAPAYASLLSTVSGMMHQAPLAPWYFSAQALPPFESIAARVHSSVFIYQSTEDAQNHWSWVFSDQSMFSSTAGRPQLRLFPGLGHCFAPMDGALGEVKTSGPLDAALLTQLEQDARQ